MSSMRHKYRLIIRGITGDRKVSICWEIQEIGTLITPAAIRFSGGHRGGAT
jgi:hypothetical protein